MVIFRKCCFSAKDWRSDGIEPVGWMLSWGPGFRGTNFQHGGNNLCTKMQREDSATLVYLAKESQSSGR